DDKASLRSTMSIEQFWSPVARFRFVPRPRQLKRAATANCLFVSTGCSMKSNHWPRQTPSGRKRHRIAIQSFSLHIRGLCDEFFGGRAKRLPERPGPRGAKDSIRFRERIAVRRIYSRRTRGTLCPARWEEMLSVALKSQI